MAVHSGRDGVAAQLAALTLERSGRPRRTVFVDAAIRGALLIDLTVAGSITNESGDIHVDDRLIGFAPADSLLAEMLACPGRSLEDVIGKENQSLPIVIGALVRTGQWQRNRSPWGTRRYKPPGSSMAGHGSSAGIAMALAYVVGLSTNDPVPSMTDDCSWMVGDVVAILRERMAYGLPYGAGYQSTAG